MTHKRTAAREGEAWREIDGEGGGGKKEKVRQKMGVDFLARGLSITPQMMT